jgi:hypothetical protein
MIPSSVSDVPTGRRPFFRIIPGVGNAGLLSAVPPGPVLGAATDDQALCDEGVAFVPEGQLRIARQFHWRECVSKKHRAPEGHLNSRHIPKLGKHIAIACFLIRPSVYPGLH